VLLGARRACGRRRAAEATLVRGDRQRRPVAAARRQGRLDGRFADAALLELLADPPRAVAALDAAAGVALGIALVALQVLGGERLDAGLRLLGSEAALAELAPQLGLRVLTARQQGQGGGAAVAGLARVLPQASTSSASASAAGAAATSGSARARMAASISRAISVFSRRKLRTLSLPWPIRSPL